MGDRAGQVVEGELQAGHIVADGLGRYPRTLSEVPGDGGGQVGLCIIREIVTQAGDTLAAAGRNDNQWDQAESQEDKKKFGLYAHGIVGRFGRNIAI